MQMRETDKGKSGRRRGHADEDADRDEVHSFKKKKKY